jgi:TrmH family RNA methyltransferase
MITSINNQRLKAAGKLNHKRHRDASGLLLVEGVRLIHDAWQSGVRPELVFSVPAQMAANEAGGKLLHLMMQAQVECLACTPAVFARLVETVTPQGIAAVAPLPRLPLPADPTLTLVLDQVRDPGNAGTLLRSAEAAGVSQVLFAPNTVDPFNDKVLRAGMGAHFRLPLRASPSWAELEALLAPTPQRYLADARATLAYDQVNWRKPSALIISGETASASPEARRLAQPVAIPMHGAAESLNAAVAGAVILFEAARQRRQGDRVTGR